MVANNYVFSADAAFIHVTCTSDKACFPLLWMENDRGFPWPLSKPMQYTCEHFFFFLAALWHMELLGLDGIRTAAMTHTIAVAMPDRLTHCTLHQTWDWGFNPCLYRTQAAAVGILTYWATAGTSHACELLYYLKKFFFLYSNAPEAYVSSQD